MRSLLPLLALSAAALSAPAMAQPGRDGPNPVGENGPIDTTKVKQVFVYGDDPCPPSASDEIVVCARLPNNDRYRIPKELRDDPYAPQNQSWVNRARSLETVGASGIDSCSPAGAGGWTGCFQKLAQAAREERKTTLGEATWTAAIEKARAERMSKVDADSEKIEAAVKADEASKASDEKAQADARARMDKQDQQAAQGQK